MSTLFQRNRLIVFEQVTKTVYMGHRHYIPMKHTFRSMKDKFNGNTEKRHPPPHLIGHEVYEMVKGVQLSLVGEKGWQEYWQR
jgi:hypothetical protein